jgi:hypothetical protein
MIEFFVFPIQVTCRVHVIVLDFVILTMFGEQCILSLRDFLHSIACFWGTRWRSWLRHAVVIMSIIIIIIIIISRSQWPCGLRRGSAAARLLGLWVRVPPRAWVSVSCECCVLSGRGLCDGLIPRPEESYRVWCV